MSFVSREILWGSRLRNPYTSPYLERPGLELEDTQPLLSVSGKGPSQEGPPFTGEDVCRVPTVLWSSPPLPSVPFRGPCHGSHWTTGGVEMGLRLGVPVGTLGCRRRRGYTLLLRRWRIGEVSFDVANLGTRGEG